MLKKTAILCAALIMLSLTACTTIENELPDVTETSVTEAEPTPYPVTAGSLEFEEAPASAVSLSPALTEIVCALGYGDKLAGVSEYCDYPESVGEKPTAGSAANPDIDEIITLKPELLLSQSPIAKKDVVRLENSGIRVLILSAPNSVDELRECYRSIAAVFGGELTADEAADEAMKPLYDALSDAENSAESFIFLLTPNLNAASSDTFLGDVFGHMAENKSDTVNQTAEDILAADPQVLILASPMTADDLPDELQSLSAVQNGRVLRLKTSMLERPTARIAEYIGSVSDALRSTAGGETSAETEEAADADEAEDDETSEEETGNE